MISIGILGYGFVGKATAELKSVATIRIYDPFLLEYSSMQHKVAVYQSDIIIACVPTPEGASGEVDLSALDQTLEDYAKLNSESIFVIKSTIPAGTTDYYCNLYSTNKIIHYPEFLTERTSIEDFNNPTDVILGGDREACAPLALLLSKFYFGKSVDIKICSAKEAELVKTVRNSFYATKVMFMNQISQLAQSIGVDYQSLECLITNSGTHPWWGPQHTKVPGPDGQAGFGGKCFPKDTSGLLHLARQHGIELSILEAAIQANNKLRKKQ